MNHIQLASAIQKRAGLPSGLRVGVVQSVDSDASLTALVGGAMLSISYMSSYAPSVGDNVCVMYFGSTWLALGAINAAINPSAAWTAYTPTWTADTTNPVLNNGTIAGNYKILGGIGFATITLSVGSSTTFGTGAYSFSLPFTLGPSSTGICGTGYVFDTSTGNYYAGTCGVSVAGTTFVRLRTHGAGNCSATVPITLASGDAIELLITAEVA